MAKSIIRIKLGTLVMGKPLLRADKIASLPTVRRLSGNLRSLLFAMPPHYVVSTCPWTAAVTGAVLARGSSNTVAICRSVPMPSRSC